jgi:hypothetical protein
MTNLFLFRHIFALQTNNIRAADWALPDSWVKRIERLPNALRRIGISG